MVILQVVAPAHSSSKVIKIRPIKYVIKIFKGAFVRISTRVNGLLIPKSQLFDHYQPSKILPGNNRL